MNRAVNSKISRQTAANDASGLADRQRAPKPSGLISACTKGKEGNAGVEMLRSAQLRVPEESMVGR